MKPAPTVRRDSDLVTRAFPFELRHARGPATNMRAFHWHDFVELSFVRSGRGTYEIEEKTFRVAKPAAFRLYRLTFAPPAADMFQVAEIVLAGAAQTRDAAGAAVEDDLLAGLAADEGRSPAEEEDADGFFAQIGRFFRRMV